MIYVGQTKPLVHPRVLEQMTEAESARNSGNPHINSAFAKHVIEQGNHFPLDNAYILVLKEVNAGSIKVGWTMSRMCTHNNISCSRCLEYMVLDNGISNGQGQEEKMLSHTHKLLGRLQGLIDNFYYSSLISKSCLNDFGKSRMMLSLGVPALWQ